MLMQDSHAPLFIQLAELLQKQIEDGKICHGDKLESEAEMMRHYGIGRLTVRSALSQLVNMGYVKKVHGKGTFCCYMPTAPTRLGIDVLLNIEDTYFIPYYLKSIGKVLNEENCDMLVSDTKDSNQEICALLNRLVDNGSHGIILQPSYDANYVPEPLLACYRRIREARIPFVMLDSAYPLEDASYLRLDEAEGGRIAANYLLELGHERAALIYYEGRQDAMLRRDGFVEIYRAHGNAHPAEYVVEQNGLESLMRDLKEGRFTAVFCYNDQLAVRLLHALKAQGLAVPREVSVLGFDDSVLAPVTDPPLSSIAHPKQLLGQETAMALIDILKGKRTTPYQRLFAPNLVIRASCAAFGYRAAVRESFTQP